jgi:hypothetical protein
LVISSKTKTNTIEIKNRSETQAKIIELSELK